jgi:monoterpene epsilon-lactone hydrolase
MASPQLEQIIQLIRSRPIREEGTIQETRQEFEMLATMFPVAADIKREPASANGVPGEWISAPNSTDATTIFYLHGGGYTIGSVNTHAEMVSRICRASGARAFSLNYRLAPENPYPAAVEDATKAYRWLLSQGIRPESIVISGDSAGGGLALATLLALKDAGDPLPGGAVLLSPWTDLLGTGNSLKTRAAADPMINPELIIQGATQYHGSTPASDPLVSPLYGDFHGLPPMLIQVGDAEVLLDDSTRLAERAKAADVDVTLEVWDEMIHVFQIFAATLPEGQQAIDRIGEWVKQHVRTGAAA